MAGWASCCHTPNTVRPSVNRRRSRFVVISRFPYCQGADTNHSLDAPTSVLPGVFGFEVEKAPRLALPEPGIVPAPCQQLGVGPLLDDLTALEHDQPVHCRHGREP